MVNYSSTLDDTYFALSNNLRRELLLHVQTGPQRLVDLAKRLKISLPALHKHIDILERARLIHKKKVGRERYVSANLMPSIPSTGTISSIQLKPTSKY
jgi:DNA-binding MarR family transcriptional regulator